MMGAKSSNGTSRAALLVAVAALLLPAALAAQGSIEERYARANQLFYNAEFEEACDLFRQIGRENPSYKDVRSQAELACTEAKAYFDEEERLFNDGLQLFRQDRFDDARQRWQQALNIPLKRPRRRAEINSYLQRLDTLRNEEQLFQQAVRSFDQGRLADARTRFQQIVAAGGKRAADARNYLSRIEAAARPAPTPPPAPPPATRAPEPARPAVTEQALRDALRAYFEGRYDDAERLLTSHIEANGPKRALAYFFRGATRSARFFLSGEQDDARRQSALADFRAARAETRNFRPPEKFVSPKVLAVYTQATQQP